MRRTARTRLPFDVPETIVAAIPARDEAGELGACLQALAAQQGAALDAVVICLNNCRDGSADLVRALAPDLPYAVHALEVALPAARACAGVARRMAMDYAAGLAGAGGILLTTDADGRVAPDWLAGNLAALRAGADAVAGRAEIEPEGARLIPAHLHAADARECAYASLLDEIHALLDPDPADPWPRHDEHSGASIAVTVAAYHLAGGMPPVALGEDRAFFTALRRVDARIRHAPEVRVTVSARTVGRAAGGMAETMRRRMTAMDEFLDDRLEPAADAMRRARLRARLRQAWDTPRAPVDRLAIRLGLPADEVAALLTEPHFGAAWAVVEARSPRLRRHRVPVADLPRQTARAAALRDRLLAARPVLISPAADPVGRPLPVAAA
jgi:hypothetical protein